jgi:hypothetical protein
MSRTASTSTQQTSSSGRLDPSPPASTPSLSRVTTHASQSLPSFSPSNPIDDFVLFPEDDSSWNSLETQDLGNFNFDINVDLNDPLFDFSFDQQPSGQSSQVGYTPAMNDQYGLGQWAEPQGFQPVSYSRPHPASSTNLSRNSSTNTSMNSSMNSSGELNADWQSGWLQAESLISPRTSTSAANYWAGSAENLQLPRSFIPCDLNHLDAPDWSLFESTMADGSSPDSTGDATNNELAEASQLSRNRKRRAESSQPQTPNIGPIDPSDQQGSERLRSQAVINSLTGSSGDSQEISRLQNAAQLVSKSLRRIKRAPAEYIALGEELQQLEGALARLQSGQHAETLLSSSDSMTLQSVRAQLEALSPSSLEQSRFPANRRRNNLSQCMRPDHARELQMTVRRLVRSLYATTNGLAALQFTSSTLDNHLQALTRLHHERQTVASSSILQTSGSISSDGFYSMILQTTQRDLLPRAIEDKSRQLQRLAQTEQDVSSRSDSNRLGSPLSSTPLPDAAYQGTSRLNVLLEEQAGGLATSQHIRMNSATTLPLDHHALGREGSEATHGIANPLPAHNSAIIFDAPPNNRDFETPQMTTVTQEPTSLVREEISSAVLQTAPTSLFETQYSFAGALSILGSMVLASNVWPPSYLTCIPLPLPSSNCSQITSGLNISAHLPYLIPLLALSLLIPGQHRTSLLTPTLIAGSFLFTSSFTSLGLQSVRTACTEWVGNEPFSAAAKLLLVAALISSELLSSVNLSVIVVAAVNYLSGTRDACSSGTAVRVSRGQTSEDVNGQGNYASLLGLMDMLSPAVTV